MTNGNHDHSYPSPRLLNVDVINYGNNYKDLIVCSGSRALQ